MCLRRPEEGIDLLELELQELELWVQGTEIGSSERAGVLFTLRLLSIPYSRLEEFSFV